MRATLAGPFDANGSMRFSPVPKQGFASFMNVSGEFTVHAPRQQVFDTLRDASSFTRFVDGVHDLKEIDPTHYEATFEAKVAYMKFKFAVTVEVTRLQEPSEIEARIEGTPLGVVGRLTAKSITRLEDAGSDTKVSYSVESTLAGKLGSIGQPVLRAKAKEMEKEFAKRLSAAFAPGSVAQDLPEVR
jgi:carbon monoxide dehydrogenase subunit G